MRRKAAIDLAAERRAQRAAEKQMAYEPAPPDSEEENLNNQNYESAPHFSRFPSNAQDNRALLYSPAPTPELHDARFAPVNFLEKPGGTKDTRNNAPFTAEEPSNGCADAALKGSPHSSQNETQSTEEETAISILSLTAQQMTECLDDDNLDIQVGSVTTSGRRGDKPIFTPNEHSMRTCQTFNRRGGYVDPLFIFG